MSLRPAIFVEGTFIPSAEGATRRFVGLAQHLAKRDIPVVVFHCFRGWSNKKLIADQPFRTYFIPPSRCSDVDLCHRLIQREGVNLAIMSDYQAVLTFAGTLKARLPELRVVFEAHDVCYDFSKSLNSSPAKVLQVCQLERQACNLVDRIVCFTDRDVTNMGRLLTSPPVVPCDAHETKAASDSSGRLVRMPFGCDLSTVRRVSSLFDSRTVLFLGNMYHEPNERAVDFLASRVAPQVRKMDEDICFLFVGDVPFPVKNRYAHSPLVFTGKVPDLNDCFSVASLAVAPIFHGSGIKVKLLDYCMAGLPILCTTEATHGITQSPENISEFAIEDDGRRFADRIVELLHRPLELYRLSEASYRLARNQDWNSVICDTVRLYTDVLTAPARHIDGSSTAAADTPYYLEDYLRKGRFPDPEEELKEVLRGGWGELDPVQGV